MAAARLARRDFLHFSTGAVLWAGVAGAQFWQERHTQLGLYSDTVAFSAPGRRLSVPAGQGDRVVPFTRVLADSPARARLLADQEEWLAGNAVWSRSIPDPHRVLESALLDLHVLSSGLPVSVAGWSVNWRYAWPRDVSFVATALARLGRVEDAARQLGFLQRVQRRDGWFEARYDLGTGRAPDARAPQLDGCGWVLWAAEQIALAEPDRARRLLVPLRTLLVASASTLLRELDPRTGLPSASPDYWEIPEAGLTLGTAAPVLAGLSAAGRILPLVGEPSLAGRTAVAADRLSARVHDDFGVTGYSRHLGGAHACASVAFLVSPIVRGVPTPPVLQALERAQQSMSRPGGGLAPGAGWKQDGISWTPETALFASAWAAIGDTARAGELVNWLGRSRTPSGSFPEKVLYDGRPAAVAPLAWTAALVVLTMHRVSQRA